MVSMKKKIHRYGGFSNIMSLSFFKGWGSRFIQTPPFPFLSLLSSNPPPFSLSLSAPPPPKHSVLNSLPPSPPGGFVIFGGRRAGKVV